MMGGHVKRFALTTVALTFALVACGSGNSTPKTSPSPSTPGRLRSTAIVTIVTPTPLEKVPTSGVKVKIKLEGATIVPAGSTNNRPDQGHVHLSVDGRVITIFGGLETSTGRLTPGDHLIQVEFVETDHSPFNPRVIQQVTVTAA
jgi:hypothetical protein